MSSTTSIRLPTLTLAHGVVAGAHPNGWIPMDQSQLLVLAGVTGVGKSTTIARMAETGTSLHILPERRTVTDKLLIPAVQSAEGETVAPVTDRMARFDYTRRFRTYFAGGMAQALQLMAIAPNLAETVLLFDGLRGADEIAYALETLPNARFVMLDAPDIVRVLRLVRRNDAFDGATLAKANPAGVDLADLFNDEVGALFSEVEVASLQSMIAEGVITADEVYAKVRIVCEERRSYEPAAARRLLEAAGDERALVIDTTAHDSAAVAAMILAACGRWFSHG